MAHTLKKELGRIRRHKRARQRLVGTPERPRMAVHRSINNMFIQLVDDTKGSTILSLSTRDKIMKDKIKSGGNLKAATALGEEFAKLAKSKGILKVVFDKSGYLYHGRIKAVADSARSNGLSF